MNKKILLGVLLCAAGLSSLFDYSIGSAFSLFGSSTVQQPLKSFSFHSGGDMQGSFHAITVKAVDDKSAHVCLEDSRWHFEVQEVKEYIVPVSLLEDIKTIFNDNKLARCERAPRSKLQVLDGATSSYSFHFQEKHIGFSSTQELSREDYLALREIRRRVTDACQQGERLPGLVLTRDAEGNLPTWSAVEPGKVAIKITGYREKILSVSIGNGMETEQTFSLQGRITLLDDPDRIISQKDTDKNVTLPPRYNDDYRWELDDRLPPGKYLLTMGGCTAEFEIR